MTTISRSFFTTALALAALFLPGNRAVADVVDDGIARAAPHRASGGCAADRSRPDLRMDNGRVVDADVLPRIEGYAAGTTGGLGGRLAVVTDPRDYDQRKGEKPIPGTVRFFVDQATREKVPLWIAFGPELGDQPRIVLDNPLRLPRNVTLDGGCSGVTLVAPPRTSGVQVFGVDNVIVTRIGFTKTEVLHAFNGDSCLRVNGVVDRVAILNNDFEGCTDGTIDITVSPNRPVPENASLTVAFNRFRNHDKTMLFGTFTCLEPKALHCGEQDAAIIRTVLPKLNLTLQGNLFDGTGQRHPRVFGRVMAHLVNNVVKFKPVRRETGAVGASYGALVTNGARALAERNLFVAGDPKASRLAVWTTTTPGGAKMPNEVEGFIRAEDNLRAEEEIVATNEPDLVPEPLYRRSMRRIDPGALGAARFAACIAARAGRDGTRDWPADLCGTR